MNSRSLKPRVEKFALKFCPMVGVLDTKNKFESTSPPCVEGGRGQYIVNVCSLVDLLQPTKPAPYQSSFSNFDLILFGDGVHKRYKTYQLYRSCSFHGWFSIYYKSISVIQHYRVFVKTQKYRQCDSNGMTLTL